METGTGAEPSLPENELPESQSLPGGNRGHHARWFQALAAVLLVCIISGGFIFIQVLRNQQPSSTVASIQRHGMCVVNGPVLNLNQGAPALKAVAAITASDAWAVGSFAKQTLIEHWDGSRWSLVHLPGLPNDAIFNAVTAVAADNIWAVGYTIAKDTLFDQPVFAHWNGQQWSFMPGAVVSSPVSRLNAISAGSANDIWAAGMIEGNQPGPLMEHWDGHQWSLVSTTHLASQDFFQSVLAISPNNAWAVGSTGYGSSGPVVIEHWDGKSWTAVQHQPENGTLSGLASASGRVWAVGTSLTGLQQIPGELIETTC